MSTTDDTHATRRGSECNDLLGPLPTVARLVVNVTNEEASDAQAIQAPAEEPEARGEE